ncbi:hypothetical protein [Pleionea sp. CnH1-48]|uniref:hypothetical protein n=1 Tax=Pleionea sp. CnH1-48 TaxID=2954494 RepID=UPI002096E2F9|nr:hypothetical protein [Pleionea sp. CnH1-48]MCO7226456.1 hypothetical protein [Pleionea sp. CnH1-48]
MKFLSATIACLFILLTTGCATVPQAKVTLNNTFFQQTDKVVGLYVSNLPKNPDTHLYGASCLLCYAVASTANSSLTKHIKTVSTDDLAILEKELTQSLKNEGINVKVIKDKLNIDELKKFSNKDGFHARKDYRSLKEKLNVDKLIVINFKNVGVFRSYSAYVPTSDPMGFVSGELYSVDLVTNRYDLYEPINIKVAVKGSWDEAPNFPGVTTAFFEALELSKSNIMHIFKANQGS